jgi:hypothetical protein
LLARCSHRSRSRPVPTASQVVKASLPSSSRMSSSWEAPDMSCRTRVRLSSPRRYRPALRDQALVHFESGQFNANSAWTVIAILAP